MQIRCKFDIAFRSRDRCFPTSILPQSQPPLKWFSWAGKPSLISATNGISPSVDIRHVLISECSSVLIHSWVRCLPVRKTTTDRLNRELTESSPRNLLLINFIAKFLEVVKIPKQNSTPTLYVWAWKSPNNMIRKCHKMAFVGPEVWTLSKFPCDLNGQLE